MLPDESRIKPEKGSDPSGGPKKLYSVLSSPLALTSKHDPKTSMPEVIRAGPIQVART